MSTTELIVVGVASAVAMLAKSATGLGYPLVAIPMVAAVAGVETAVVVVTLPNAVANLLVGWRTRHARSETRDVFILSATSAVGAVAGTLVLISAPERPLLIVLAAAVLLFVIRSLWFGDIAVAPEVGRRASPAVGAAAGVMQGAVGVSGADHRVVALRLPAAPRRLHPVAVGAAPDHRRRPDNHAGVNRRLQLRPADRGRGGIRAGAGRPAPRGAHQRASTSVPTGDEQATPPLVIRFDALARLTTSDGASRLEQAAISVRQHMEAPVPEVLDERELELLKRLADGVAIADLAAEMGHSERSVYRALANLWKKLGVPGRNEGVQKAASAGYLD